MSTVIEKWDEILGIVKKEHDLSDVRFDTWLKPLKVYDVSGKDSFLGRCRPSAHI